MLSASDKEEWWRGAVIYQVYPRSFMDSNGDGIGDLDGVTARLDYIAALGVDAVWLSPIFTSPMADFGYDVSDYRDVDPMFGSLDDLDRLIAAAHDRGLKVLFDLVLSHSSDQHPWFKLSRSSRDNARADWYVWADAKPDGTPPNNWLSIFGGSAWEWNSTRQQYFLHNFLTSQPDLNYHNREVQLAMLEVARFWLERGADGFRLDTVNFYFHDKLLRDNPPAPEDLVTATVQRSNPYARQIHLHDKTQAENLTFLEDLRRVMNEFPGTFLVGELGVDEDVYGNMAAYTKKDKRLHMAYSFELLTPRCSAMYIRDKVGAMDAGVADGWPSWAVGNHDFPRVATRWGGAGDPDDFAAMAVALVTSLRGTACLYQGDELGLVEADVPFEKLQDPYGIRFWPEFKGRDGCRTPMPWTADHPSAGFSTNPAPWLPVDPRHFDRAVAQLDDKPGSSLNRIRHFLLWRRGVAEMHTGALHFIKTPEPILAFIRGPLDTGVLVVLNLARNSITFTLAEIGRSVPISVEAFSSRKSGDQLELPPRGVYFGRLG